MTLDVFGLIAQVLGLVFVAASLVFVGVQMRQTHAIETGNAQRDIWNQTRDWWMTVSYTHLTLPTKRIV